MIPQIEIHETQKCGLHIIDTSRKTSEYIAEDQEVTTEQYQENVYKYSDTYTINIIEKVTTEKSTITGTIYSGHTDNEDEAFYTFPSDGYYIIHHLILPTVDWLETQLQKDNNITTKNLSIYVTDGNCIYHWQDSKLVSVEPSILTQINQEGTTISRISIEQFSICQIFECYLKLSKTIFDSINMKCPSKTNLDDIRFKRDFVWMTINAIKYYVDNDQLLEAQRLLERINYCGGFCNSSDQSDTGSSGCGCNRQS